MRRSPRHPKSADSPTTPWRFPANRRLASVVRRKKQASLRAGIYFEFQSLIVLPGDVQAPRYAHQRRRSVAPALFAGGLILGRVPGIRDLARLGVERQAGEIPLEGRHHSQSPVVADNRYPVARQIDRRRGFRGLWRLRCASATLGAQAQRAERKQDGRFQEGVCREHSDGSA